MTKDNYFFQDFLFEDLPVNEQDYPDVEIIMISKDIAQTMNAEMLSLDYLLRCNKEKEWDDIFEKIKDKDVLIIDDIKLINQEMKPYKDFYLRTYCYNIERHCRKCFVMKNNQSPDYSKDTVIGI